MVHHVSVYIIYIYIHTQRHGTSCECVYNIHIYIYTHRHGTSCECVYNIHTYTHMEFMSMYVCSPPDI